jgi:hypothetical protein
MTSELDRWEARPPVPLKGKRDPIGLWAPPVSVGEAAPPAA